MFWVRLILVASLISACGDSSQQTDRSTTESNAEKQCLSIVNGQETSSRPEVVLVGTQNSVCSGVFISDRILLTAAHCIPEEVQELRYLKGAHIEDFSNSYFLGISAQQALKGTQGNDSESVEGSNDIAVVVFPEKTASAFATISFESSATNAQLFGFGLTTLSGESSEGAKKRQVGQVIRQKKYGKNGMYFTRQELSFAAHGDSGGGVFAGNSLIGIISGTRLISADYAETFAVDLSDQQTQMFMKDAASKLNFTLPRGTCH